MQSTRVSRIVTLPPESFLDLRKGTSAPYFLEILAIFLLSVETTIFEKIFDFKAILITCPIRGQFLTFNIFLL